MRKERFVGMILLTLLGLLSAPAAQAQPAGNHMCGDGTTFTVHDTVTLSQVTVEAELPKGCRIYALFVSGYSQNKDFDHLVFFKVAEFVAKNNGYAHWAWWNNFLGEYLDAADPFFAFGASIPNPSITDPFGEIPLGLGGPHPGGYHPNQGQGFAPASLHLDAGQQALCVIFRGDLSGGCNGIIPIANPEDASGFKQRAATWISAVRANNPHALIVVAGQGMGGTSAVQLAVDYPAVEIDLLAVIDPIGIQTLPEGRSGFPDFNWTRWRAVRGTFQGYKRADCIRDPNFFNLCRDFDPNLFGISFRCTTVGGWLQSPPSFPGTDAPLICPGPIVDAGTRLRIGVNVKRLYHRWQTEFTPFPQDNQASEAFAHYAPRSDSTFLQGSNYQHPIATCRSGLDPRNPIYTCLNNDGHGELVGYRGSFAPALKMLNWPTDPAGRRQKLLELSTALPSWPHRPVDENLCLVCDDMIAIIQNLMDNQPPPPPPADMTPPVTVATAVPGPNGNGWSNEDVVITLNAADGVGGTGVKEIEHSLSGDSPASTMITAGSTAQETITTEGATTFTFFARDNASPANVEAAQSLVVQLDKTPPEINAVTDVQPNASGWNKTNVMVGFPASDALSGLEAPVADVPVSTEGANQEISGTASDLAGNQATAIATLNIDKTLPSITLASRTPAANAAGWNNTDVTFTWDCTDALSGAASPSVTQSVSSEGAAQMVIGACTDLAGNTASDTQSGINMDKTSPTAAGTPSRGPDQNGWYNHSLSVAWAGADALSGIASCSADSPYNGPDSASASVSGSCSDNAGNASAAATASFQFDDTNPTITITTPPSGAAYLLNAAVNSDYACTDSLSGVQSCSGPVASGAAVNTASVGAKHFTVNGSDVAGNSGSATHNYAVHYAFSGFANPIGPLPMVNVANAGRTVPVKYYLQDANGAFISDLASFVSLLSAPVACDAGAPGVLAEETDAAGGTGIRYDAAANQFIYNWKTDKAWAGTCRALQLTLSDGRQHLAMFRFQ